MCDFDAATLSSEASTTPAWLSGQVADLIRLPVRPKAAPTSYVHEYLDQVGQATAPDGDPAHAFKRFGRDIADAVRSELLP